MALSDRAAGNNDAPVRVWFRINGVGAAFLREPGYHYPQDADYRLVANTSGSLLIEQGGQLAFHLLFDCGLGVVDSLLKADIGKLTHVFISHNHPDHFLELDRLFQGYRRAAARAEQPFRVPCYCTQGTRACGPDKLFGYLRWDRHDVVPGVPVIPWAFRGQDHFDTPGLGVKLRVTPISVYHGNPAIVPDPVIWSIDFRLQGVSRRIVLGWDFLHFIPPYAGQDIEHAPRRLYNGPTSQEQLTALHAETLSRADLLVLEANTLYPKPMTGHTSLEANIKATIPLLQPRGPVWFVHYSGMEPYALPPDLPEHPLSDADLKSIIAKIQQNHPPADGYDLVLAQPGDTWSPLDQEHHGLSGGLSDPGISRGTSPKGQTPRPETTRPEAFQHDSTGSSSSRHGSPGDELLGGESSARGV